MSYMADFNELVTEKLKEFEDIQKARLGDIVTQAKELFGSQIDDIRSVSATNVEEDIKQQSNQSEQFQEEQEDLLKDLLQKWAWWLLKHFDQRLYDDSLYAEFTHDYQDDWSIDLKEEEQDPQEDDYELEEEEQEPEEDITVEDEMAAAL